MQYMRYISFSDRSPRSVHLKRKPFDMTAPLRLTSHPCLPIAGALLACASSLAMAATPAATAPMVLEVEAGAAWQEKNDVQQPNDATGTRFALDRVTGGGPFFAPRFQLSMGVAPKHELRFVVAPLGLKGSGTFDQAVNFNGQRFAAGGVSAKYRFDSYRATWRYTFSENADWTWKVGATAKIRDAEITLTQGGVTSTKANTGLVPLIHLYGERRLDNRSRVTFEGDGLASSRGRAFDLSLRYVRDINDRMSGFVGVRMLDGGTKGGESYNFARFNYLTVGLQYRM